MSMSKDLQAVCKTIQQAYSCCDVADALLKIGVSQAGFVPDIGPIPRKGNVGRRIVAPISTVLFVSKDHEASPATKAPQESNIPKNTHWTDCPSPGSIVLMQQPQGQICALLGDLVASRLRFRGVLGAVIDGRVRDIASCGELCDESSFQVWSKAFSTVGTSLEAKPWLVDIPLSIGGWTVSAGDIMVADEAERGITIIPRSKLDEAVALLPGLKEADDNVLKDVNQGVSLKEAFARHRG